MYFLVRIFSSISVKHGRILTKLTTVLLSIRSTWHWWHSEGHDSYVKFNFFPMESHRPTVYRRRALSFCCIYSLWERSVTCSRFTYTAVSTIATFQYFIRMFSQCIRQRVIGALNTIIRKPIDIDRRVQKTLGLLLTLWCFVRKYFYRPCRTAYNSLNLSTGAGVAATLYFQ